MAARLNPTRQRSGAGLRTRIRLIVSCVLAGGLLAGCGGSGAAPVPDAQRSAPATGNAIDVMFLQMMLEQHHQAAVVLRMAAARAVRPEVRTMAAAMEATQRTEAETMTDWLRRWGQPSTVDPKAHQAHDAHGGYDVLHGTTAADIELLKSTGPDEFDRTLLNILVAHQHNAVELARMQRDGGSHPAVTRFAAQIDRSRTAQIEHLLTLLGSAA